MSNVIQFLESMGANAAMARMPIPDYEAAVAALNVEENQRDSLRRGDAKRLGDQLNGRDTLLCLVFSPSEEEERKAPDQEEESSEEEPKAE
ncbi:MAG: hypothetical protein HOP03_14975 [Lysobacter sp.]|nr:hypothetical protein [Lysobacter sp.]